MVKTVRRVFLCVVLCYNDSLVVFQRLIEACEEQILRFPINIYFYRICCKKINTSTNIVDDGGPIRFFSNKNTLEVLTCGSVFSPHQYLASYIKRKIAN